MFTVKLMKEMHVVTDAKGNHKGRFSTKIVEASEVNIHILRPNELAEVSGECDGNNFAFYISDRNKARPEGFAEEVDFWFAAFIENSSGATTEVVRF
jgi:hypothetical protein